MAKQNLPLVVVADPDPEYQQHIVKALSSSCRCLVTRNLQETYQAIQNERPALVTLELELFL